jgi:formylglycine-generating enzyme required for sulfatase activity
MKRIMIMIWIAMGLLTSVARADGAKSQCGADAVPVGSVCLDTYEASVWRVPNPNTTNAALVKRIQLGIATRSDLTAGGATQLGAVVDADYAPCTINGQNCADDIFAVSLPSEIPAANITWFQALEACANSGKRLPTNAEWQMGVTGTPDSGPDNGTTDCNTTSGVGASPTGTRVSCISSPGAFDMVGNLAEWVADWVPAPEFCAGWGGFSDDEMCLSGASTNSNFPGALTRGGAFAALGGKRAGPAAVHPFPPSHRTNFIGFRCAR